MTKYSRSKTKKKIVNENQSKNNQNETLDRINQQ